MRYVSLALRTLSRLDLTSSRGITCMSVALWLLHKICSDTVVGLQLLVCLFVEAVFKSTSGFSYVLFVTMVTLYHVDIAFGVAINVMINFADRIKRIQVSPSLWQQLLLFIKGLVSGTHILARKRKKKWNHFSTERCNCRKMWRSRPRFNFTENGGGFDAGTARWNMFIQFDIFWVESKRITFTLGKGERNMCTEATVVTVVPETWRRYGHRKAVSKHVDKTASDILRPLWSQHREGNKYRVWSEHLF